MTKKTSGRAAAKACSLLLLLLWVHRCSGCSSHKALDEEASRGEIHAIMLLLQLLLLLPCAAVGTSNRMMVSGGRRLRLVPPCLRRADTDKVIVAGTEETKTDSVPDCSSTRKTNSINSTTIKEATLCVPCTMTSAAVGDNLAVRDSSNKKRRRRKSRYVRFLHTKRTQEFKNKMAFTQLSLLFPTRFTSTCLLWSLLASFPL